ncbi:MAG: hypothetical protein IBX40_09995 [Methanosarcinales archaeon]|nr:hypothetical protein [Methanosarcinales archaeon]
MAAVLCTGTGGSLWVESGGRSVVLGHVRFFRVLIMLRGGGFYGCFAMAVKI